MKKGFTLIELLIVIGILAILATTVVLVLNPAQILAESRDTQRISDMDTVRNALNLLLVSTTTTNVLSNTANCYTHTATAMIAGCTPSAAPATTRFTAGVAQTSVSRVVTGGGWIPVNFTQVSGGSPLSVEPVDPTNTGDFYYAFRSNASNQYELDANLESTKYTVTTNKENADGGDQSSMYEVGTSLTL